MPTNDRSFWDQVKINAIDKLALGLLASIVILIFSYKWELYNSCNEEVLAITKNVVNTINTETNELAKYIRQYVAIVEEYKGRRKISGDKGEKLLKLKVDILTSIDLITNRKVISEYKKIPSLASDIKASTIKLKKNMLTNTSPLLREKNIKELEDKFYTFLIELEGATKQIIINEFKEDTICPSFWSGLF